MVVSTGLPTPPRYFDYFGTPAGEPGLGYYSYDLGGWHIVVLNSNCDQVGGCDSGSSQHTWLVQDLAASESDCTLAYWHDPLFSSGVSTGAPEVDSFFEALYAAEAEVVINAADHLYERFGPQDPDGGSDQEGGIRQFIVGTGGRSLDQFGSTAPNSEARFNEAFGVLVLTLLDDGYEWSFETTDGSSFSDVGAGSCG